MFKRRTVVIGAIILILVTAVTTFVGTGILYLTFGNGLFYGLNVGKPSAYQKMNEVKGFIQKYYVEPVDENKLMEGAAAGIAEAVKDPYTVYMDQNQYKDLMVQTEGSYAGLGIEVSVDPSDNLITVVAPFEGTPGEKAGILSGDKIIKVNGQEVWGDKLQDAVNMMKGPKGTDVTITIARGDLSQPKDIKITRDIIVLQTVKHKVMDGDIGYIRISMFDEKTSKDFNTALDDLLSKNIKGLVIDVRDDPGGLLDEVVKIADRLLPEGTIVYTEDREKHQDVRKSDATELKVPLALLVNGGSASASEILSGAVKDYGKGTLVGTKTFGKGLVQNIFPLSDGSAVKVTIAKYYTPKGVCIQGIGIQPDVEVKLPEDLEKKSISQVKEEEDVQLQKAIEIVKQKMQ